MKLIRIMVDGLKLFKNKHFDINLISSSKVTELNGEGVDKLFNRVYINRIISLLGRNASGKTTEISIYDFAVRVFLLNESINQVRSSRILIGDSFKFTLYFYDEDNNMIYKVVSNIFRNEDKSLEFDDEIIYEKNVTSLTNKNNMYDFEGFKTNKRYSRLEQSDEILSVLAKDLTYFRIITNGINIPGLLNLSDLNNANYMIPITNNGSGFDYNTVNNKILNYLDPSIEYIHVIKKSNDEKSYEIKFNDSSNPIFVSPGEVDDYLSSGTIKGMTIFGGINIAMYQGATVIVDEIENHFHRAIVETIIEMFKDKDVNTHGSMLLFSTHYPELLDTFDRNDNIYVSTKNNGQIELQRFSESVKRNDIKISDIYKSNYLNGTSPSYKAMRELLDTVSKFNRR